MIYIDVRTKLEYDNGHVEGAINHDASDILDGIFPDLPKDTPITLYCKSGSRSTMAKIMLEQAGFTNVTNGGAMQVILDRQAGKG